MKLLRPPASDTVRQLDRSGSSVSPSPSYDKCSLRTESKPIQIPTIFDDGEAYDSLLPTPSSDTHNFWATESATEAFSLDRTFQRLTAKLDNLYSPSGEEGHSRLEPFKTLSIQAPTTKRTTMASLKRAKTVPDPLSPLSPIEGFNDSRRLREGPPRRSSMVIGLARMRSTYENENSGYEAVHFETPSPRRPQKKMKCIPLLEIGEELPDTGGWQLPTPTSPTRNMPALMEAAVDPSLVGTSLSDVPVPPGRKRGIHEDTYLLTRSRAKRVKS